MIASIAITPPSAEDAGCSASFAVEASGAYPMPGADVDNYVYSGQYTQYRYSATPVAGWLFLHFKVEYDDHYKWQDLIAGTSGEETRTHSTIVSEGTQAWTWVDAISRSSNPFVEDELHTEWVNANTGDVFYITDDSRTIKSVVAVFVRDLPHGPILCNQSGVMLCNQSGALLWN